MTARLLFILSVLFPMNIWAQNVTNVPATRICNQSGDYFTDNMAARFYTDVSSSPFTCDVTQSGTNYIPGYGLQGDGVIGWMKTSEGNLSPWIYTYFRSYILFQFPSNISISDTTKIEVVFKVSTVTKGYYAGTPIMRVFLSPTLMSVLTMQTKNGIGTSNSSIPDLPASGIYFDLPTSINGNELRISIPYYLWSLLNSEFVLSFTIIPEDQFIGEHGTINDGFSYLLGSDKPYLEITHYNESEYPQSEDCPDGYCSDDEYNNNTCFEDCTYDLEEPTIFVGKFTSLWPDSCGINLEPKKFPAGAIDTIGDQYINENSLAGSINNASDVAINCIREIPESPVEIELNSALAYYSPDFMLKEYFYNLGIKVEDNFGLHRVEVQINNETVYTWNAPPGPELIKIWPYNYNRLCSLPEDSKLKMDFGNLPDFHVPDDLAGINIPKPDWCSSGIFEVNIPIMEKFCTTGRTEIKIIATDIFDNVKERTHLIHGKGNKVLPEVTTPESEVIATNKLKIGSSYVPILLPGDYVDLGFDIKSPFGIRRISAELEGEVLFDEVITSCDVSGAVTIGDIDITKTPSGEYNIKYFNRPDFLSDRRYLYSGPHSTRLTITIEDGAGEVTTQKKIGVMLGNFYQPGRNFNPLHEITYAETDSTTGALTNIQRDGFGMSLLPTEGFFANFHNATAKGVDSFDGYKDWSFIKTYLTTYHSIKGKPGWEGISPSRTTYKILLCLIGGVFVGKCDYLNYIITAPILGRWLVTRDGYCGGFSSTYQMWRNGAINASSFDSCGYYEGKPDATERTPCTSTSESCYYDCCSVRDRINNNWCYDSLESNDLYQYIAGMHGKQVTAEYFAFAIDRYFDGYVGITDNFLKRLFFSMYPNPHTPLADQMIIQGGSQKVTWLDFLNDFNYSWNETETFTDGRLINQDPVILNINWPKAGHYVVPLHLQKLSDRWRLYIYDSNYPQTTYGMTCLRNDDNTALDTSPDDNTSGNSWAAKCGPAKYGSNEFPSKRNFPIDESYWRFIDIFPETKDYFYDTNTTKNIALLTTHEMRIPPADYTNLIWELLTDTTLINESEIKAEESSTTPFLSNDNISFYAYENAEQIENKQVKWKIDGSGSYVQSFKRKYFIEITADGKTDEKITIQSNADQKYSNLNINGPQKTNIKIVNYVETERKTSDGKSLKINGKIDNYEHSYLGDITIQSSEKQVGNILTGWDGVDLVLENLNSYPLEYSIDFTTSYVPYIEGIEKITDFGEQADLYSQYNIPYDKTETGTIQSNQRITFSPEWFKYPDSKVIIKESTAQGSIHNEINESTGCNCDITKNRKTEKNQILFIILLVLMGRIYFKKKYLRG